MYQIYRLVWLLYIKNNNNIIIKISKLNILTQTFVLNINIKLK